MSLAIQPAQPGSAPRLDRLARQPGMVQAAERGADHQEDSKPQRLRQVAQESLRVQRHAPAAGALDQRQLGPGGDAAVPLDQAATTVIGRAGLGGREVRRDGRLEAVGVDLLVGQRDRGRRLQFQCVGVAQRPARAGALAPAGDGLQAHRAHPLGREPRSIAAVTAVLPTPVLVPVMNRPGVMWLC